MNLLHFKERFTEFSKSYLYRNFWLIIVLLFLSFHQATILTYAEFGLDVISRDSSIGKTFSGYVDIVLLKRIGLFKIALKFSQYLILLLACQSVPAFIYGCFTSLKHKRKAALVIWLLPSLLGLSTLSFEGVLGCMFIYLISPFSAIYTFPGFIFSEVSGSIEDFSDAGLYQFAVVGWFHIFWLGITIKIWLFPKLFRQAIKKY